MVKKLEEEKLKGVDYLTKFMRMEQEVKTLCFKECLIHKWARAVTSNTSVEHQIRLKFTDRRILYAEIELLGLVMKVTQALLRGVGQRCPC